MDENIRCRINLGLLDRVGWYGLEKEFFDVLVVGSGVAGLRTAIEILNRKDVSLAIITKDSRESNSKYAQGGIAVALGERDNARLHVRDTMNVGAGLCDVRTVNIVVKEAPERVKELVGWGCTFDKSNRNFDFGLESAHSVARIVHYKDKTGDVLCDVLKKKVSERSPVWFDGCFCVDFLLNRGFVGVLVLDKHEELKLLLAKACVLASGGVGQIYSNTTNPLGSTGDGIAMGYRAGALLRGMEFVQFHPTALSAETVGGRCFLISESVRGAGAFLVNSVGERFMGKYSRNKDLATRDVVSRAIWNEMLGGRSVFLDMRLLDGSFVRRRFPTIVKECERNGIDVSVDLLPIVPAAHYLVGGIKTDLFGRCNIGGIFVVGEAASTGLHGANRLASNSLAEALVFGRRCGVGVLRYIEKNEQKKPAPPKGRRVRPRGFFGGVSKIKNKIQESCWGGLGILRSRQSITDGLLMLKSVEGELGTTLFLSREYFEAVNMLTVAKLVGVAAMKRKESRGAHYRSDYPKKIDSWRKNINITR